MRSLSIFRLRFCMVMVALLAAGMLTGCKGYRYYRFEASSMEPTVKKGQHFFVNETKAGRTELHDGDIIAFRHDNSILLKRIMAMPGETISGQDRKIFRNGQPLTETYLAPTMEKPNARVSFPERTIPASELFVLGDNRDRSLDSREEDFGHVYLADVDGKLLGYYPR